MSNDRLPIRFSLGFSYIATFMAGSCVFATGDQSLKAEHAVFAYSIMAVVCALFHWIPRWFDISIKRRSKP